MNTFGRIFRISIFGESHGTAIGVVVDGCPAGIPITEEMFLPDLSRRRSGAVGTTPRIENDVPKIVSGVFQNRSTGAPICIQFANTNTRSDDYSHLVKHPRPGHADFTAHNKYHGFNDLRGGGHFSGRITLSLVAAGVIAKQIINPVSISSEILEIGGKADYQDILNQAIANHDSLGGIIQCTANSIPVGLGEPFFDSVESVLSHLIFSIPAIKGIEFGAGFSAAKMRGSQHNDCITDTNGQTITNNAGGINGGISNGNPLVFRVAVKPTSSIGKSQDTFNFENQLVEELQINGRHDSCIALRIPVVVEAATAVVLADLMLVRSSTFPKS